MDLQRIKWHAEKMLELLKKDPNRLVNLHVEVETALNNPLKRVDATPPDK